MKLAPKKLIHSAVLGAAVAVMALPAQAREVKLESLKPTEAQYRTRQNPTFPSHPYGEGVWSPGSVYRNWSNIHFWPDNIKIVKEAPKLPEGFDSAAAHPNGYYSWIQDRFVVDGESVAGVGLWLRICSMEHWVDFKIPHRARNFSALVYLTDDNSGYMNGQGNYAGYREGELRVTIDGEQVQEPLKFSNWGKAGMLVGTLEFKIPPNAKKIRFHLVGSDSVDWNKNTELVIVDGVFN